MTKENKEFDEWFKTIKYDPFNEEDPDGMWYPIIRYWAWKAWEQRAKNKPEPITERWCAIVLLEFDLKNLVDRINFHFLGEK